MILLHAVEQVNFLPQNASVAVSEHGNTGKVLGPWGGGGGGVEGGGCMCPPFPDS